ncbi:hypothetical protein B0H12DRAFT_1202107 [Mycena haematopus]|nr:hypothetical protein B0H12DRAFT_1202107 [Mycena haematopus]
MFLPDVVSFHSQTNPAHAVYVYAEPDPSDRVVSITNLEYARATHRVARFLRPNREGADGQVVAIIALSDTLLYQSLIVGLITANLIPFPISPRNSPAAVLHLLRKTDCHRLIATRTTLSPLLAGLQDELARIDPDFHLSITEVPSIAQIYPKLGSETADYDFEPYPSHMAVFELDDICLYLHSSGSTGLPKPVAHTHRIIINWASNDTFCLVQEMRDTYPYTVAAMPLPSFHLIGIFVHLLIPVYGGKNTTALYPPTATTPEALPVFPSPDNILSNTRKTQSKIMMILPALLALWSTSPETLAFLKTLALIGYGGGVLPRRIGDTLVNAGLKIQTLYGATEFGQINSAVPYKGDENEWEYLRFSDKVNVRWVPQGDGTFECQLLHCATHSPSIENLSDVRGFATSDLFVNHPTKKHLWKVVGRTDDVIIHASGENTVPAPMEDVVMSSPYVAATVMFGRDHNQTGILIEPTAKAQVDVGDPTQVAVLCDKLWPIIEEANRIAPKFSRIFREMVIFTSPEKPLPRSGKNTVLRKAALAAFETEIEALCVTFDFAIADAPSAWAIGNIQEWLLRLAVDLSQSRKPTISSNQDLFEQGFDSLSASFMKLRIVGTMRSSQEASVQKAADGVTQNAVYSYRTISQLSSFLASLVAGSTGDAVDVKKATEDMILKYSSTLSPSVSILATTTTPATVLLTGSTGSLGSQILASLLKDTRVAKVYALNRFSAGKTLAARQAKAGTSLAARHLAVFEDKGLDITLLDSFKLVLSYTMKEFSQMLNSLTLIIHNAWTVNFNLPLSSYEQHISGTRSLIDFAQSCARPPMLIFTSSITAALSESSVTDATHAASFAIGYGQSKYVAEQILAKSGLHIACLRICQICGSLPKGAWPTANWFPILVKTGLTLGKLPNANGRVSWIDFETVAQAVLDVAFNSFADAQRPFYTFNLVHPRPVSWNQILVAVRDLVKSKKIGGSPELKFVDFSEWCAELQLLATKRSSTSDYEDLPGLKLLDFFSDLSHLSSVSANAEFGGLDLATDHIHGISSSVKSAQQLGTENVERWLEYWHSIGFL